MGGAAVGDSRHDEPVPRLLFTRNLRPTPPRCVDCGIRTALEALALRFDLSLNFAAVGLSPTNKSVQPMGSAIHRLGGRQRTGDRWQSDRWDIGEPSRPAAELHQFGVAVLSTAKDMVLAEDASPLRCPNAAINTSLCRNVVINLLRCNGFSSIPQGLITFAHDLPRLLLLTQ